MESYFILCPKCGVQNSSTSNFCLKCASPLKGNTVPAQQYSRSSYQYLVLQVVLKEKFIGTGSGNLSELENVINMQASRGYRLHTITTASSGSKGMLGGDRIQATLVFESI